MAQSVALSACQRPGANLKQQAAAAVLAGSSSTVPGPAVTVTRRACNLSPSRLKSFKLPLQCRGPGRRRPRQLESAQREAQDRASPGTKYYY